MRQHMLRKSLRQFLVYLLGFLLFLFIFLIIVAERFVEPMLKDRLHTLIVQGSDSLYTYKLKDLDASFLGGSVEIEGLEINVDSTRYRKLLAKHTLPSLTMQLDVGKGHIKGIGVFALVFSKKVLIHEIYSQDANVRLIRHNKEEVGKVPNSQPLWKAIQPAIKLIDIDHIALDGIKLLYKNADTSESLKLQFDTCYAAFENIRIDSLSSADVSRMGFAKEVSMRFRDLKFRTADSTYKMKAEEIAYSSRNRVFEITDFKIQPTLKEKEDFYKAIGHQASMNVITFEKAQLTNFRIDQFINSDIIAADSLFIQAPVFSFYSDKTYPPVLESKMGKYPHQNLLNASPNIQIKGMAMKKANLIYTEKGVKSGAEGKLTINDFDVAISNITNDAQLIRRNPRCIASIKGGILGKSPIALDFIFYLDSTNGRFDARGTIQNVNAAQLNSIAAPLSNTRLQSFNMHHLQFNLSGNDYGTKGNVAMRYDNLYMLLQKKDEETGEISNKKFLTKIVNKYTLLDSNPGPDGRERKADSVIKARISSQPFIGLVWQTVLTGMQNVMMNTGRKE